ncbi:hypothetical protein O3797_05110 [Gemella sanguinis]|uniref:hypothetical protein n=1 Tax=Gemella sanguinis TaxID=84135 RepID=UPI00352ED3EF
MQSGLNEGESQRLEVHASNPWVITQRENHPFSGEVIIIVFIGWIKERQNIVFEKFSRRKMLQTILKKQDRKSKITKEDKELYNNLVEITPADSDNLKNDIKGMATDILDNVENPKEFAKKELSVY